MDSVSLGRFDLTQVGSNNRDCLRVLPSAKSKRQKVVIGDDTGVATCVAVKKGVTEPQFKSKPNNREVTALVLGGDREVKDKVYIACGQTIQGLKKKGTEFFKFNTSLNEDIMNMYVEDLSIWTTCEYILNMFENYKDTHFFMANDKINHFTPALLPDPPPENEDYHSILACQDRYVRVLHDSSLYYEQAVDGPVNHVMVYHGVPEGGDDDNFGGFGADLHRFRQIMYGTDHGAVGQLLLDASTIRKGFELDNEQKRSGVSTMGTLDVTHDGVPDLVVGRDDGTLEIYGFEGSRSPTEVFSRELNESITGIAEGNVLGVKEKDLVVSTYAGKVLCYSHEVKSNVATVRPRGTKAADKEAKFGARSTPAQEHKEESNAEYANLANEESIAGLRTELAALEEKVEREKEKYGKMSGDMVAVETQFKIKKSFKLLAEEACYLLSVEIQMPLDVVAIQCDVPVLLLDVVTNNAMVSYTVPDAGDTTNKLLAAYRCQAATNRIEIKIRTIEGQHGNLKVYVIPKLSPKTSQMAEIHIKPLSLHAKVHMSDVEEQLRTRPINTLTLTGSFSLNEMHSWVGTCLPSVTPRLHSEEASIAFKSTFLNTVLSCHYTKGRAAFKSDSATVISILKEVITREATQKKVQIDISMDFKKESIPSFLNLMRPLLDHHFALAKRNSLIAPLQEIQTHEEDTSFLSEEYQDILKNANQIRAEFKVAPMHLDFLRGIVNDLFVDMFKLRSKRVQSKDALTRAMDKYNFDAILEAFNV